MNRSSLFDRRQFLRLTAMAAAGTVVAACTSTGGGGSSGGGSSTAGPSNGQFRITKTDVEYVQDIPFNGALKEAPTLAALVKEGKLPPVDQRVPKPPYVIPHPWLSEGKFGGQMIWVCSDPTDGSTSYNLINAQYGHSIIRWLNDGSTIGPYIAHSWTANNDLSQWTFHFRQGLKWSDGQPWTVDDILFWWEDEIRVLPGMTPSQEFRSSKGTPVKMVKVDDYTLRLQYDAPTPLAANYIASWAKRMANIANPTGTGPQMMDPKHYLSQFHIKYNPGLPPGSWATNFTAKQDWTRNPDNPTMSPWKCQSWKSGQYITMDRNPYYWGIDKWGNQMPYMDQITNQNFQDPQSMRLAIQQGKADFVSGDQIGLTLADVSTMQSTPDMDLFYWDSGSGTASSYFFNYDYADPKLRTLFRNPKFRQALSLAFNRANARKVIYFGQGTDVTTGTMSTKAVEFHVGSGPTLYKQWRDAWVGFDPAKASQMLDSIGVKKVGQWRTMPDGSPLQITLNYNSSSSNEDIQKSQLLASDWQAIGINASPDPGEALSRLSLWAAGQLQMQCDSDSGTDGPNCLVYPNWLVPMDPQRWAPLEGQWFLLQGTPQANQQQNVDPWSRTPPNLQPDPGGPVDQIIKLYQSAPGTVDFMQRNHAVWNIMKIHVNEGPFFTGTVSDVPSVEMCKKDMQNVPRRNQTYLGGYTKPWTIVPNGKYDPSTWFWSDPSSHPVS